MFFYEINNNNNNFVNRLITCFFDMSIIVELFEAEVKLFFFKLIELFQMNNDSPL